MVQGQDQAVTKQPLKYPDWPADAPDKDPNGWVHSIAVVDGQVCDFQLHQPISVLSLEKNNQPDPCKGYMRTIRRGWRLRPCSRPGTGCKGTCVATSVGTCRDVAGRKRKAGGQW